MKFYITIALFIFAGTSSQAAEQCYQKYVYCTLPVINGWGKEDRCRLAVPFLKCASNVTTECYPDSAPYFENYESLITDMCDDSKKEERKKMLECVITNSKSLRECTNSSDGASCVEASDSTTCITSTMTEKCGEFAGDFAKKLMFVFTRVFEWCQKIETVEKCLQNNTERFRTCKTSEEFNKVGDICGSLYEQIQCSVREASAACHKEGEEYVRYFTDDIAFLTDVCRKVEFISQIPIPKCHREVLKCNAHLSNTNDPQCTDVSAYVGCIAEAARTCAGEEKPLYLLALERYKTKFPDYCNAESTFNKDLGLKLECINSASDGVFDTCYKKLAKDMEEVNQNDKVGTLRAYVNLIGCLRKDLGTECGQEAEFAVSELLSPLGESMDESCRLMTGKRCNSSAGLVAGTWILISAIAFLLTPKYA